MPEQFHVNLSLLTPGQLRAPGRDPFAGTHEKLR